MGINKKLLFWIENNNSENIKVFLEKNSRLNLDKSIQFALNWDKADAFMALLHARPHLLNQPTHFLSRIIQHNAHHCLKALLSKVNPKSPFDFEFSTELISICASLNRYKVLEQLLSLPLMDQAHSDINNALCVASGQGWPESVKVLLPYANCNVNQGLPLSYAVQSQNVEVVKLLKDQVHPRWQAASLRQAAQQGKLVMVQTLWDIEVAQKWGQRTWKNIQNHPDCIQWIQSQLSQHDLNQALPQPSSCLRKQRL